MPDSNIENDDDLSKWDYGTYEGKRTREIEAMRPGWRLSCDGCPTGETLDAVRLRADRVIDRIRSSNDNVLLFAYREILRILAVRWIGLAPIEGRHLLPATASLSALGYDHDINQPVIHNWNEQIRAVAIPQ
jgi:probable phosphoglycerate mutase